MRGRISSGGGRQGVRAGQVASASASLPDPVASETEEQTLEREQK
jgi:hypothetical protein